MFDFTDQVVLVTGAAGNLGRAVAIAFAAAGAHLILPDRGAGRLTAALPDLSGSHLFVDGIDLTDEAGVQGVVDEAVRRFGQIDVLVTPGGGWKPGKPTHETSLVDWYTLFDRNFRTVLIPSRAVVPHMLARGSGKIIHVGAAAASLKGGANKSAHTAAKSAVLRLTESMSEELKHAGINVNCVLPGVIATPQNRAGMPDADTSEWVSPESLADVILFLASPAARGIHGAAIPVVGPDLKG